MNFRFSGALWRHTDFLRLWAAQAVSTFGARITREGLPLAAVMTINAPASQLGLLVALAQGPALVVAMLCGGYVDRSSRRAILIGTDLLRAAVLLTVPLAAWFHLLSMFQLYAVAAVAGGASVLFDIADHAYLPSLIARDDLMEGNTKLNVTESIAEIGGPALAGVLVQLLTAPFAIAANAVTYLMSALFLSTIRAREAHLNERHPQKPWHHGFRGGLAEIFAQPLLRPLFWMALISPLFGAFFSALYVIWAIKGLGLSPALMGVTIAVGGVAALLGTAIAAPALKWLGAGRAIVITYLISGASSLFIPLAHGPLAWRVAFLMLAQLFGDAFAVAAIVISTSLRQSLVPLHFMGRVAAVFGTAAGAPAIAGALLGGTLGEVFGMRETLLFAAAGVALTPLIGAFSPLWRLRDMPVAPGPAPG
ncbi:MAG: MFS transporter [Proteobacteria bacterium]|nr:MFS transporter [Pseudomonadota bacterium]